MLSRQINDFLQKRNRKNELIPRTCKLAQLQTNVSVHALALNLQLDRQVEHADIWGWLERTEGQESEFRLGALLLESLILDWQKMNIG